MLLTTDSARSGITHKLVVFMHGFASNQNQLLTDSGLFPVRDALLRAGYTIAMSNAHGNNVGNGVSVDDQQLLVRDAESRLGTTFDRIDILAFSMGGLDALLAAATNAIPRLKTLALLSPVTDPNAFLDGAYRAAISSAYGQPSDLSQVVASRNPSLLPATDFVRYRFGFWRSPSDGVVPAAQSDAMAARLSRAGATVIVNALTGDHGNFSDLHPAQVVSLLDRGGPP